MVLFDNLIFWDDHEPNIDVKEMKQNLLLDKNVEEKLKRILERKNKAQWTPKYYIYLINLPYRYVG